MTHLGNIEAGHPVILTDAKGLGKYGLSKNMKGFANAVTHVGDESYVHFMPDNIRQVFVIQHRRVVLDEERLNELEEQA